MACVVLRWREPEIHVRVTRSMNILKITQEGKTFYECFFSSQSNPADGHISRPFG